MKVYFSLSLLAVAQSFSPSTMQMRRTTQLSARADSSDLIKQALEASKTYGPSSPEARLAWEAVEEVDSSDNSAATKGTVSDYSSKLKELAGKIKEQAPAMSVFNAMADDLKAVKLAAPKSSAGPPSEQLQEAMATAKQLTEEHGIHSPEARVAWDVVEEIASAGSGNALGGMMTAEECLVEAAMEACEALEELNRALDGIDGLQKEE